MAPSMLKQERRVAPRRSVFSVFALVSFIALFLLALSVLSSNQQDPRKVVSPFEEVNDVDFDNADEVTEFLTSKVRQSATGDEFL